MVVEQLKKPMVVRISDILDLAKSPIIDGFMHYLIDLKKYHIQARDNVKFLSTLLRHFKTVTYCDDFVRVKESIPVLMDGLHLIWVLSRYYCTDETMVPLMQRIVYCLVDKVRANLDNQSLFRNPVGYIQKVTQAAREMLEIWKSSYMETRQKIEDSGKGQRWEFDKKKLFERSDYMATVCKDLYEVAVIIEEFNNIFGPELRAMVVDPQKIDNVTKRVEKLLLNIEITEFDIFNENYKENWDAVMVYFHKEVRKLEQEGVSFIDQSFKNLRSSEGALEMLNKLKNVKTRQIILDRLRIKFDNILDQFTKEILIVDDAFTVKFGAHKGAGFFKVLFFITEK